jgi:hypothetical protein
MRLNPTLTTRKQRSHRVAHILREKRTSSVFDAFLMLSRVPFSIAASFQG